MEHLRVVGAAMELRRSIVGLPVLCWSIETGCGMLLQPNVTPANDDTALPAGEELLRPKRDSGERRHCTTGRGGAATTKTRLRRTTALHYRPGRSCCSNDLALRYKFGRERAFIAPAG